jgi:hypothetical protein
VLQSLQVPSLRLLVNNPLRTAILVSLLVVRPGLLPSTTLAPEKPTLNDSLPIPPTSRKSASFGDTTIDWRVPKFDLSTRSGEEEEAEPDREVVGVEQLEVAGVDLRRGDLIDGRQMVKSQERKNRRSIKRERNRNVGRRNRESWIPKTSGDEVNRNEPRSRLNSLRCRAGITPVSKSSNARRRNAQLVDLLPLLPLEDRNEVVEEVREEEEAVS